MIALLNWVALQTAKDTSGQSIHLTMRTSVGESTNAKGPREETGRETELRLKQMKSRTIIQLLKRSVKVFYKIEVFTSKLFYPINGKRKVALDH